MQEQEQGYSALDMTFKGGSEGVREPWPLGRWVFAFKDIQRGFQSSFDDKERCKFIFTATECVRAKRNAATADIPKPRQPAEFVGEDYHAWTNFYTQPGPRSTMHKWISAIIGHPLEPNENINLTEYIGAEVEVTIGLSDNGNHHVIIDMQTYEPDEVDDAPEPEPEPVAPVGRTRRSTPQPGTRDPWDKN